MGQEVSPMLDAAPTAHTALVSRLSRQSVEKHFDAYRDIDWENPEHAIDVRDPRWEKDSDDPLGRTDWYRQLPQPLRAKIGLHHIVCQLKVGIDFEGVLARGLLEFASALPDRSADFRYAYHELIEEAQHSLMFREFVNRSGLSAPGLGGFDAFASRFIPRLGRVFPELFFLFVLGGEAPIDWVQRRTLARKRALHPLLHRIMRIHVTEEARHIGFAKSYLLEHAPRLNPLRRLRLRIQTPLILSATARGMLVPPSVLVKTYAIPREVMKQAYGTEPARVRVIQSFLPVRKLCHKIGLITDSTRWLWYAAGVAPAPKLEPPRLPAPGIIGHVPEAWSRPLDLAP
jgi:hypothetical protein